MPPFLQFLIRRLLAIPISLLIVTMILYGGVMLTPPEARAELYFPKEVPARWSEEDYERITEIIIERYHLRDPYPVQYAFWARTLLDGTWGYGRTLNDYVLPTLLRRTPATMELLLYSCLLFIPLGLASGVISGWRQNRPVDTTFRLFAFLGTSFPVFIMALIMLSVFYVRLGWFSPERISMTYSIQISFQDFRSYTGMITLDALLNGRLDIFFDALRHLAMPVLTLSLYHWATLGRITRSIIVAERGREYVTAARSHGLSERSVMWKHAFRNTIAPSFTSIGLSAAALITGVFVVEIIYNFNGISLVIVQSMQGIPDAPAALGFAVYSVIMVLLLMLVLDVMQAIFDPRVREEVLKS